MLASKVTKRPTSPNKPKTTSTFSRPNNMTSTPNLANNKSPLDANFEDGLIEEPDYINVRSLKKRFPPPKPDILRFPNVVAYASTQHILALYGNPRQE